MNLQELSEQIRSISLEQVNNLKREVEQVENIFLIGNGGSNAIASHMAIDYTKFLNKRCITLAASDMMSMLMNDYDPNEAYERFIEYNYLPNSLAILISSSGNSLNVVNAAKKCHDLKLPMILLSGFNSTNKLNTFESSFVKQKFWVSSDSYGVVEMTHHSYLHSII